MLDSVLSWREHVGYNIDKNFKGVGMLRLCYRILLRYCPFAIYDAYIYPYLLSDTKFVGMAADKLLNSLIILHKNCVRIIENVSIYEHYAPVAK